MSGRLRKSGRSIGGLRSHKRARYVPIGRAITDSHGLSRITPLAHRQTEPALSRSPRLRRVDGERPRRSYVVSDGNRDGNEGSRQRPTAVVNSHAPSQDLT